MKEEEGDEAEHMKYVSRYSKAKFRHLDDHEALGSSRSLRI